VPGSGVVSMLVIFLIFTLPVAALASLLEHFTNYPAVAAVVLYAFEWLLYLCFSLYLWRTTFAHLPHEDAAENVTSGSPPRLPDMEQGMPTTLRPTRISFMQHLWCMHMHFPFFALDSLSQTARLNILRILNYLGLVRVTPAGELLASLLLETTMSWWFDLQVSDPSGALYAHFSSKPFGQLTVPGREIEVIEIIVDVHARKAVKAKIVDVHSANAVTISIEEALHIATFVAVTAAHIWLHAYSQYGTSLKSPCPFVSRMSLVTIFHNSLGQEAVENTLIPMLAESGQESRFFTTAMMGDDKWSELVRHSRFLSFIQKLRPVFLNLMSLPEYRCDFANIDPHAHFVCTVVHSLDHQLAGHYFTQSQSISFFFQKQSVEAGTNLDATGNFVEFAAGLTSDFPKLFEVYMRNSPVEFYRRVYKEAAIIDSELAWHMQCCIVK
jgi:hypothetical protein